MSQTGDDMIMSQSDDDKPMPQDDNRVLRERIKELEAMNSRLSAAVHHYETMFSGATTTKKNYNPSPPPLPTSPIPKPPPGFLLAGADLSPPRDQAPTLPKPPSGFSFSGADLSPPRDQAPTLPKSPTTNEKRESDLKNLIRSVFHYDGFAAKNNPKSHASSSKYGGKSGGMDAPMHRDGSDQASPSSSKCGGKSGETHAPMDDDDSDHEYMVPRKYPKN